MAKEYIEREALKEDLKESYDRLRAIYDSLTYDEDKQICAGQLTTFTEAILRVKDAPAADVVEVVRCKDCKYSGMYCFGTSKEETLACLETEEDGFIRFATSVKADDYCSRGERKMDKEVADDKKQPEEAPGE